MKKQLLVAATAALVLAACSQNELVEQTTGSPIGFNVLSENASRATPVTPANLTTKAPNFQVWAYKQLTDNIYVGGSKTTGIKINYAGGKWDYDNPNDIGYWPSFGLDFYAVNPYDAGSYSVEKNSQKVAFTVKDANAQQVDLMYAIKKGQLQSTNAGKVTMTFKHALSQVVFKGKTDNVNLKVIVKDIEICNLKYKGAFTFPAAEATPATASSWTLDADTKNFVAGLAAPVQLSKSMGVKTFTNESTGAFMLMPQTSTKWGTAVGAPVALSVADASKHTYLKISLIYKSKDTDIYGKLASEEYKDVYVPFQAEWEPGKRYIYTLNFGGGYNVDGNPILKPITYDSEVEAWADSSQELSGF